MSLYAVCYVYLYVLYVVLLCSVCEYVYVHGQLHTDKVCNKVTSICYNWLCKITGLDVMKTNLFWVSVHILLYQDTVPKNIKSAAYATVEWQSCPAPWSME